MIGTFVFAAVGTPSTDPFSMLFLAMPMLVVVPRRRGDRAPGRPRPGRGRDSTDQWTDDEVSPLWPRRRSPTLTRSTCPTGWVTGRSLGHRTAADRPPRPGRLTGTRTSCSRATCSPSTSPIPRRPRRGHPHARPPYVAARAAAPADPGRSGHGRRPRYLVRRPTACSSVHPRPPGPSAPIRGGSSVRLCLGLRGSAAGATLVCGAWPATSPCYQPDRGQGQGRQGARRGTREAAERRAERARPQRAGRRRGARPGPGRRGRRRRSTGGARRRRHGPPGRAGGGRDRDPARDHPGRHRERRGPLLRPPAQGPGGGRRHGDQGGPPGRSTWPGAAPSTSRPCCAPASTRWSTSGPTG